LHPGLRLTYLTAGVLLLLPLPVGQAPVLLALFAATTLAAAAPMLNPQAVHRGSVVPIGADPATLALMRRTVPTLRQHRPVAAVEAQVRWRQAAEARRQFRVIS
jgi:hypothetical protein